MADYRKSLMDMTPEERAEVAPGFVPSDDVSTPLSVKVAEEAISLATPIDSIVEIQQELAKDEPDYLKIGMLGGMEAIGLLAPGAGKAAQSMIRKGADMARQTDNVVDVASNIPQVPRSVTPSYTDEALLEADDILAEWGKGNLTNPQLRKAMSDKGFKIETKTISPKMTADDIEVVGPDGNIVRWKDMPRGTGAIDPVDPDYVKTLTEPADVDTLEALNLTQADVEAWMVDNYAKDKYRVPPIADVADAAKQLREDPNFTSEQFREISNRLQPIKPLTEMPKMPTKEEVVYSIAAQGNKKKTAKGVIGVNKTIKDGTPISSRLDIPAYNNSDTWVVSLHDGTKKSGDTVGYAQTAVLDNVEFTTIPLAASSIAAGNAKSTIARMQGAWKNANPEAVYANAEELLKSVVSGENTEWVQVGMNPYRASYFYDKADGMPVVSAEQVIQVGPLVLAKKAKKTTPDDPMFEFTNKVTGVTKTFSEGGMAMDEQMDAVFKSSRTGYAEGGEVGAAPDTTIGVDPVSGNEVPMGATPEEVRDDIPAQLSEGEYVVPADVVRFYGVKFFEDLRTEAKQGYAEMDQNGRIGGEPVGPEGMEMIEPEDDLPFDISELQTIDDEVEMAEGGYLERAMNREEPINRFESLLQFLFKDKDEYGETPIDRYKEQMGDDDMGFFESFMGNPIERGERKYGKKGYAEGGLPEAPAATPVPPNPFSITGSGSYEIKEYVNDAGEVMYIQFMNGQPMTFIPQGFKPKGSAAEEAASEETSVAATAAPATTSDDYDSGAEMGKVDDAFAQGASATDWTKATADDFANATKGLGSGLGTMTGAVVGGPIGAAIGIGSQDAARRKAYDMLDGIAYQLESGNLTEDQKSGLITQQQQIQKYLEPTSREGKFGSGIVKGSGIFGGATSLYENLGDYGGTVVDGEVVGDGKRTFADTWLGDLLGADGKAGVQGPGLSESLSGARRTAPDWEDEGSKDRAAERMKAREASPYEKAMAEAAKQKAEGNTEAANAAYDDAISTATNSWQAATNAVNSVSASDDPAAWNAAIRAQSEASRAATKAIQEKNNRTGFFGLKTKKD